MSESVWIVDWDEVGVSTVVVVVLVVVVVVTVVVVVGIKVVVVVVTGRTKVRESHALSSRLSSWRKNRMIQLNIH